MLGEVLNNVGAFIYTKDLRCVYTYVNQPVLDNADAYIYMKDIE